MAPSVLAMLARNATAPLAQTSAAQHVDQRGHDERDHVQQERDDRELGEEPTQIQPVCDAPEHGDEPAQVQPGRDTQEHGDELEQPREDTESGDDKIDDEEGAAEEHEEGEHAYINTSCTITPNVTVIKNDHSGRTWHVTPEMIVSKCGKAFVRVQRNRVAARCKGTSSNAFTKFAGFRTQVDGQRFTADWTIFDKMVNARITACAAMVGMSHSDCVVKALARRKKIRRCPC